MIKSHYKDWVHSLFIRMRTPYAVDYARNINVFGALTTYDADGHDV
jgi:hypothetical protein